MTSVLAAAELDRFRGAVARRLGLQIGEDRSALAAEVFARRLEALGETSDGYLARWQRDAWPPEVQAVAEELAVGETYFFRNIEQFRVLREVVLPEHARDAPPGGKIALLSAGCASGEEPYSLAITAREALEGYGRSALVRGLELRRSALARAAAARYTAWSLRETPPETVARWFERSGRELVLRDEIRNAVELAEWNLADDQLPWPMAAYDVVFCRNVLMYLTPAAARTLVARLAAALRPGGYLFLGHAETLRGLSRRFQLVQSHGTFYYRLHGAVGLEAEATPARAPAPAVRPIDVAAMASDGSWVDTIQRAAERIRDLTARPAREDAAPARRWDTGGALELLREERFADALARLDGCESADDPEVLLLGAVLLAHGGELARAESACRRLLALDGMHAGAHYVLALCREGAGERARAADHDRTAVYLDPTFAMPRLHLGLLARRAGEREAARRELARALELLEGEEPSRLLLFGGGFNRETLVGLCRAELAACGGAA